jgi:hypothetical protein
MSTPTDVARKSPSLHDDGWTVAAIAVLAYVVANVAHETVGHGAGLLLAGGRSGIFTTTRLIVPAPVPDPAWRIFDLGGPAGNLVFGALGWLGARKFSIARTRWRLFSWLVMAFSLFWGFVYLLFSGVMGRGDWLALLPGDGGVGRVPLAIVGWLLYVASVRLAANELGRILDRSAFDVQMRARRLAGIAWLAGGVIATAGAALDPRGAWEMINSGALSSFGAAVGLLQVPRRMKTLPATTSFADASITRSTSWLVAALAVSLFFIAILGRGIAWRL